MQWSWSTLQYKAWVGPGASCSKRAVFHRSQALLHHMTCLMRQKRFFAIKELDKDSSQKRVAASFGRPTEPNGQCSGGIVPNVSPLRIKACAFWHIFCLTSCPSRCSTTDCTWIRRHVPSWKVCVARASNTVGAWMFALLCCEPSGSQAMSPSALMVAKLEEDWGLQADGPHSWTVPTSYTIRTDIYL